MKNAISVSVQASSSALGAKNDQLMTMIIDSPYQNQGHKTYRIVNVSQDNVGMTQEGGMVTTTLTGAPRGRKRIAHQPPSGPQPRGQLGDDIIIDSPSGLGENTIVIGQSKQLIVHFAHSPTAGRPHSSLFSGRSHRARPS